MSLRNTFLADYYYRILKNRLLPKIAHVFATPNQFTMLGFVLALIVPFGFYLHPVFGLLFIVLSGIADSMDGLVARSRGMDTVFGAFLDSSLDRVSDFLYLLGFWVLFWEGKLLILASALIFSTFLFAVMISYTKARSESLGGTCEAGLMERGVRTIYLIVWALLLCIFPADGDKILWSGLILFCILNFVTMMQRILHIRSKLER